MIANPESDCVSEPLTPTRRECRQARLSSRKWAGFENRELRISIPETGDVVVLPAAVVRLVADSLAMMASGRTVSLVPVQMEMTIRDAAETLGVSPRFLKAQLDGGCIPFVHSGKRRRISYNDLMKYKRGIDAKRAKTLEKLAAQAQEFGMGY